MASLLPMSDLGWLAVPPCWVIALEAVSSSAKPPPAPAAPAPADGKKAPLPPLRLCFYVVPGTADPKFETFDAFLRKRQYDVLALPGNQKYVTGQIKRGGMMKIPPSVSIKQQPYIPSHDSTGWLMLVTSTVMAISGQFGKFSASLVPSSMAFEAARVMTSQFCSGRRTSKLVLVMAAAVGLALLAPSAPCNAAKPPPGMVRVYHYTNKAGRDGIIESGQIRPSDIKQGDACYGTGVYATKLEPTCPIWDILKNNYDNDGGIQGRGEDKMDRADYYFAYDLPQEKVTFITEGNRSVGYFGNGDPVDVKKTILAGKASRFEDALEMQTRIRVYHYMDKKRYNESIRRGFISPSDMRQGRASCKRGVLVTDLPPSTDLIKILYNNRADACHDATDDSQENLKNQADFVLAFDLLPGTVTFATEGKRSIGWIAGRVKTSSATYYGHRCDMKKWMPDIATVMKQKPGLYENESECFRALEQEKELRQWERRLEAEDRILRDAFERRYWCGVMTIPFIHLFFRIVRFMVLLRASEWLEMHLGIPAPRTAFCAPEKHCGKRVSSWFLVMVTLASVDALRLAGGWFAEPPALRLKCQGAIQKVFATKLEKSETCIAILDCLPLWMWFGSIPPAFAAVQMQELVRRYRLASAHIEALEQATGGCKASSRSVAGALVLHQVDATRWCLSSFLSQFLSRNGSEEVPGGIKDLRRLLGAFLDSCDEKGERGVAASEISERGWHGCWRVPLLAAKASLALESWGAQRSWQVQQLKEQTVSPEPPFRTKDDRLR
eukprot:Skav236257  [mRNA]  locus=scaffold829:512902:520258:- [translate_table: standard]